MRTCSLHILVISFVLLSTSVVHASKVERGIEPVPINDTTDTERRIALVIGNGGYKSSPLKNPVNDAVDVSARLGRLGFEVAKGMDMTRKEMRKAIRKYGNDLKKGGVGLFYYSGHGMQVKGRNYLIPVGVDIQSEDEVEDEAIDAGMVLRKMDSAGNAMNMVFLDACRDNPFARSFRSSQGGLAQMDAPSGSLIVYSTAPGSIAADGSGRNGTFTKNLLLHLSISGLEVGQLLRKVRVSVKKETGGKQIPWESSSLEGNFYFVSKEHDNAIRQDIAIPSFPGKIESVDFGDIEKLAEVKAKWAEWQGNLDAAYKDALKYDKNTYLNVSEKVQVWQRLADGFSQNNPYSTEDQLMRSKAMDRLNYWKSYKEPKPAIENLPVVINKKLDFDKTSTIERRSSYRKLSVSQVQALTNISIRSKKDWGFYGHSTINHSYNLNSINGDKLVIDHATDLMWHQNGSKKDMNWKVAEKWVKDLNKSGYAGYHDWRLPTVEEAASLLEFSKKNGGLYIDPIFSSKQLFIWTGDKKYGSDGAWGVDFYGGLVYWDGIKHNHFVRPVRSGS